MVLWSQRVFADRPSTGFTATILCGAAGFIIGPIVFGALASEAGLATVPAAAAVLTLLTAVIRPTE